MVINLSNYTNIVLSEDKLWIVIKTNIFDLKSSIENLLDSVQLKFHNSYVSKAELLDKYNTDIAVCVYSGAHQR